MTLIKLNREVKQMKKTLMSLTLIPAVGLLLITNPSQAKSELDPSSAKKQIVRYLTNLQTGNVADMKDLFTSKGYVISTTKGEKPAVPFFNAFLPELKEGKITLRRIYPAEKDSVWYSASFHYSHT